MPQRFLRPQIRQSKRFNRLPFFEQSFFVRLITIVDDYGRYEAEPIVLRNEVFPYGAPDGSDVSLLTIVSGLRALCAQNMIIVYETEGSFFLQLLRWKERTRTASRYPDPKICNLLTNVSALLSPCEQMSAASTATATSTATVPPNPQSECGKRLHGIPSNAEEVIEYGKTLNPPKPESVCREFFAHYEAQARTNPNGDLFWITSGNSVVTNWKIKLSTFGNYENQKIGQENSGGTGSQGQSQRRTTSQERNSFIAGYVEDGPESAANILKLRREKRDRTAAAKDVPTTLPSTNKTA